MTDETIRRARNDKLLSDALRYGEASNMNELEVFEMLVHVLLDLKDEAYQARLNELIYSSKPMFPLGFGRD